MLIDAEFRTPTGTWHPVRLWVDTGNPDLMLSAPCAAALGTPVPADSASIPVATPAELRIGGMPLDLAGVNTRAMNEPRWLFSTMHNDANLPSTVLARYDVVIDYPNHKLTIAPSGSLPLRGITVPAAVNSRTGIVQIDAVTGRDTMSFALDNGASYSFTSFGVLENIAKHFPDAPQMTGAYGCANIWGWWPDEQAWRVMRIPRVHCPATAAMVREAGFSGALVFENVGMVGLPDFFAGGTSIGMRYSRKSARPVVGFLGPNVLKQYCVHIAYSRGLVSFEKGPDTPSSDMDIAGLTLQPTPDGGWMILGVAQHDGRSIAEGVQTGDILLEIDGFVVTGATMGTVMDKLRGSPGEKHTLLVEHNGARTRVTATVKRLM